MNAIKGLTDVDASNAGFGKSGHTMGVLLVCVSALVFSTAGIFTKAVAADAWGVIFWRGLSAMLFSFGFLALRGRFGNEIRRMGWPTLLATIFMASGTAAFIPAFKLTTVANVSLIWATAPFVTALLAWICLREVPSRRTLLASAAALLGVAITLGGSFESGHIIGDGLAIWMTLMMAATMVTYRAWPHTPTVMPAALSSLVLLPPALVLSDPMAVSRTEIWVLIGFGLVFSVASITLSEGARRIPSAQAALISALETPLAPLWAFFILAETPATLTLIGGATVFAAVLWSQVRGSKHQAAHRKLPEP